MRSGLVAMAREGAGALHGCLPAIIILAGLALAFAVL